MLGWAALRARTRGEEGESSWGGVCGEAGVPFYRVAREATAVKPSRHRGRRNGKEKKGAWARWAGWAVLVGWARSSLRRWKEKLIRIYF
jgi:hypothetical protein